MKFINIIILVAVLFLSVSCTGTRVLPRKDFPLEHRRVKYTTNQIANGGVIEDLNLSVKKGDAILILGEGDRLHLLQLYYPIYRHVSETNKRWQIQFNQTVYYSKIKSNGNLSLIIEDRRLELIGNNKPIVGEYNLDIFILPYNRENDLPDLLNEFVKANPKDIQLADNYQRFMNQVGNKLAKKKQQLVIWDEYCGSGQLFGYINFVKKFPNHPRILDGLEGISNSLLTTYKTYMWDLENYVDYDKNEKLYFGFWANTTNSEAIELFQKAADTGQALADFILGDIYYLGTKDFDPDLAYKYALKSAEQENIFGKFLLTKLVYLGIGIPMNKAYANHIADEIYPLLKNRLSVFQAKSAANQLEQSLIEYCMAWLHQKGLGAPKNEKYSKKLYINASKSGYLPAVYNLALIQVEGNRTKKELRAGEQVISNFARKRFQRAQSNLAWLYQHDKGSGENQTMALNWYRWKDEALWARIQQYKNMKDCYRYDSIFPNGIHIKEVKQLIIALRKSAPGNEEYIALVKKDPARLTWKLFSDKPLEWTSIIHLCSQLGEWRTPTIKELLYYYKVRPNLLKNESYCSSDFITWSGVKVLKNGKATSVAANASCLLYCAQTKID